MTTKKSTTAKKTAAARTAEKMVRVFHPTLNTFEDVPAGKVEEWVKTGWKKTRPEHVPAEGLPPVGEHPGFATIPVLEDVSSTTSAPRAARTATPTATPSTPSGAPAGPTS